LPWLFRIDDEPTAVEEAVSDAAWRAALSIESSEMAKLE
jgi:hypothetical protein